MYAPVFCAQQIVGGIAGGEAFGQPCERLGIDGRKACAFGFEQLLDGRAIRGVVGTHPAAEGEQLFAFGHVDAGGDHDLLRADLKVEAGARGFFHAAAGPPGREVGFVRELVFAEADVAIDAHGDLVGRADVLGREGFEGEVDLVDESEHGGFERVLEGVAARFKPVAVVVSGEAAEEFEGVWREVRGHGVSMPGEVGAAQNVGVGGCLRGGGLGRAYSPGGFGRVGTQGVALALMRRAVGTWGGGCSVGGGRFEGSFGGVEGWDTGLIPIADDSWRRRSFPVMTRSVHRARDAIFPGR